MIQMERWGSITKGNCLTWGMHDLSQCHTRATHTQKHLKTQKIRFLYKHLKYLHQTLFGGKLVTLMNLISESPQVGRWMILADFFLSVFCVQKSDSSMTETHSALGRKITAYRTFARNRLLSRRKSFTWLSHTPNFLFLDAEWQCTSV